VQPGGPGIQTQGGDITVRTTGSASHLELHATVNSRGGSVGMQIGGGVTMAAAASISTSGGDFAAQVGGAWTMADQSIVNTAAGTIRLEAGGDITVGQFATTNGTASAVLLRSTGGGIVDGGDSGGVDILANSAGAIVTIEAATGVGSSVGNGGDAAIESQIDTLVLRNASAGNVQLDEVDNLRIHELTQTGAGDVTVNSVGNLLLVGGQLGLTATSGTVTLSAAAAASTMTIESKVQTTSGNVVISAANDVMMGATSQIVSQSGNVTVIADADANVNGLGGQIFMANGAVIDAGNGNITARADENITVGRMVTASTVSLTSTSAGIVDGGDAGGADIAANALVMQTRTGIGAANTLETAVSLLAANNTASGAIQINNNTGGLLTIGQVGDVIGVANAGSTAHVLDIVNNGGITVNGAVRNSTGGDVDLTANANGGGDDHLTVNAVIAAANGNGDVFLTAGNNLIINDSGNGGGDDISVVNGGEILGSAGGDVLLGEDVVIRSSTGVVTGTQVDPVLIDVITPQINALGIGTITMTVQEPLEVGTVIVIDWGDGTIETFVVTDPGELTLTFTHTYTAPPDPGNPAADIPLKVTVLNPSFTTGLAGSGVAGTVLIDNGQYVPNIRFAAGGDVLGANDVGVLNQTIYTGVFKTPGEGLASFVFDVTPEVQILDFPQPSSPDASLLAAPQPPAQQNTLDVIAARAEELLADERVVILEVLGPDGELIETVVLSESVLDDIDGVVADLPNGNYRFLLREAGESQTRLLQDVDVHEGKIVGDSDSMLLRPRSLRRTAPLDAMTTFDRSQDATEGQSPPADALNPDNSVTNKTVTDDGVTDNSAADHRFVNNSSDGEPAVNSWSARRAWRRALAAAGEMHHDEGAAAQSDLVGDETGDGHLRVGPMAAPMSVRPSGFGRAARLMRLHGAP
ncbi:MAG: hypothetical protein SFV23_13785, partial [Planctomycetaceae bacterium]|nr:hypothetical protein [Planctomycetaceae bacterium]